MSEIYYALTSTVNKISDRIHESFLFSTIIFILTFFEDKWVNSYFKKFYPSKNF